MDRGYDWSRDRFVLLDHRVVHFEMMKMYDWIVVGPS